MAGTILTTYRTLVGQKIKLERKVSDAKKELIESESELKKIEELIKYLEKNNPEIKDDFTPITEDTTTWKDKLLVVFNNHPNAIKFGEIVDSVYQHGLDNDLDKGTVQRRVNTQLFYMAKNGAVKKELRDGVHYYSLTKK